MPIVTYIAADGAQYPVDLDQQTSLMEGAVLNDVPGIIGLCGGICSCATCHCYIGPEWSQGLEAPSEGERAMLERAIDRRPESRLGCQIRVTAALDGLVVGLPARQSAGEI